MTIYFITDGTRYHDGDVEEVYGVIETHLSKRFIQHIVAETMANRQYDTINEDLKQLFLRQNIKYTEFDWEHETNVIGAGVQ